MRFEKQTRIGVESTKPMPITVPHPNGKRPTMGLTALFVNVDDCWLAFQPDNERHLLDAGACKRRRRTRLSVSEIVTILIAFQTSNFRDFKHFYFYLLIHHRREFPGLVLTTPSSNSYHAPPYRCWIISARGALGFNQTLGRRPPFTPLLNPNSG